MFGQCKPKGTSFAYLRFGSDFPTQLIYNRLTDRESESVTVFITLQTHKTIEDTLQFIRRNTRTGIANIKPKSILGRLISDTDTTLCGKFDCIRYKIGHNLSNSVTIRMNHTRRQPGLCYNLYRRVRAYLHTEQLFQIIQ